MAGPAWRSRCLREEEEEGGRGGEGGGGGPVEGREDRGGLAAHVTHRQRAGGRERATNAPGHQPSPRSAARHDVTAAPAHRPPAARAPAAAPHWPPHGEPPGKADAHAPQEGGGEAGGAHASLRGVCTGGSGRGRTHARSVPPRDGGGGKGDAHTNRRCALRRDGGGRGPGPPRFPGTALLWGRAPRRGLGFCRPLPSRWPRPASPRPRGAPPRPGRHAPTSEKLRDLITNVIKGIKPRRVPPGWQARGGKASGHRAGQLPAAEEEEGGGTGSCPPLLPGMPGSSSSSI